MITTLKNVVVYQLVETSMTMVQVEMCTIVALMGLMYSIIFGAGIS